MTETQKALLSLGLSEFQKVLPEVFLERVKGIEPSYAAWEAAVLPLNYTRVGVRWAL